MNIYESITKIMEEIPAIGKNKMNVQQNFMFRGIDDVMNSIQPLLSKNKVFIVPEILEQIREERTTQKGSNLIYSICKIKYKFYAEDGTSIEAITIGEGMDSGDKATNKAMAIAMKYALFQVFCIPTEEIKDTDGETPPESVKKNTKETFSQISNTNLKVLQAMIKTLGNEAKGFYSNVLQTYKIIDLSQLTNEQYGEIMIEIKKIKGE